MRESKQLLEKDCVMFLIFSPQVLNLEALSDYVVDKKQNCKSEMNREHNVWNQLWVSVCPVSSAQSIKHHSCLKPDCFSLFSHAASLFWCVVVKSHTTCAETFVHKWAAEVWLLIWILCKSRGRLCVNMSVLCFCFPRGVCRVDKRVCEEKIMCFLDVLVNLSEGDTLTAKVTFHYGG